MSHALSGAGKVNPQTRDLVRRVAAEVGYRPSARARALRGGRSNVLGVVSSMSQSVAGGPARLGFFMEVAAAAAERALAHGFALVLVPPGGDSVASSLDTVAVDGVLVVEPAEDDPVIEHALTHQIPFVALGRDGTDAAAPHVDLHAVAVADLLVTHLARQGLRHPVLMVGDRARPSYQAVVDRYLAEARTQGWEPVVLHLVEADGAHGARTATNGLFADRPETDGIIAFVDAFAAGVLVELGALGVSVPGQCVVVTRYDGVIARTALPRITAVQMHLGTAAAHAVDLLVKQIGAGPAGGEADLPQLPALHPPELVVRESSLRRRQDEHP